MNEFKSRTSPFARIKPPRTSPINLNKLSPKPRMLRSPQPTMTASEYKGFIEMQKLRILRATSQIPKISSQTRLPAPAEQTLLKRVKSSPSPTFKPPTMLMKPPMPVTKRSPNKVLSLTCDSFKAQDDQQNPHYILGRQLGKGAYATVRQAVHRENRRQVAVKIYEKYRLIDISKKQGVRREIKIMQKLDHFNIVKLCESIETPKQIHIVMELVKGSSLLTHLKKQPGRKLSEDETRRLYRQVLQGIEYCHSQDVTHRDLKLENLLMDENDNIRIIDFGFATCYPPDKRVKLFCGTPSYMAPEIVGRKEYRGQPADVWALGVLLFTMLTGTFPFKGASDSDLYKKIQRGVFSVPSDVPEAAKYLIEQMLLLDPEQRPTISELLTDDWFIAPESLEEGQVAKLTETIRSCKNPFSKERNDPLGVRSLVIDLSCSQEDVTIRLENTHSFATTLYSQLKRKPLEFVKGSQESTA